MAEPENEGTPKEWTLPDQVMRLYRMKLKKRALQARMNKWNHPNTNNHQHVAENVSETFGAESSQRLPQKRKNPFVINETSKKQRDVPDSSAGLEISRDNTLFELLKIDAQREERSSIGSSADNSLTFTNVVAKLESTSQISDINAPKGANYIPIDWTLKTKMRFMSLKPFPWNGKLKTSEEASGTTGFVRCLNIGEKETTLDTSPNARFHQCCLIWQHPSLPWLELFPRSAGKVSASLASNIGIGNNQCIKDALNREWCDSFRSLFHLLRAGQCPYFYVCANTFTVLFRAAGICGLSEIHALVTPTTRGFRQSLKQEEIQYSMPLKKDSKRRSNMEDSDSKCVNTASETQTTNHRQKDDDYEEEEEDEAQDAWLESLGIENSEIRKINHSQTRMTLEKESEVDNLRQSLVFVKGVETQALFNFLINCKSTTVATGALAGIPPTLLSPTAFHGATLKPLKVRESVISVDDNRYYSLELKGPLLPHVLPSFCHLMKSSQLEQYSASCAQLVPTIPFSMVPKHAQVNTTKGEAQSCAIVPANVFGQENLSDCGFNEELLSHFCSLDPTRIEVVESIKFFNGLYTWS